MDEIPKEFSLVYVAQCHRAYVPIIRTSTLARCCPRLYHAGQHSPPLCGTSDLIFYQRHHMWRIVGAKYDQSYNEIHMYWPSRLDPGRLESSTSRIEKLLLLWCHVPGSGPRPRQQRVLHASLRGTRST